ncbi:CapA family protein [Inquilinus limosus]|uniref:CapA family protein n=1 Tax=Inquilinus limosus TaxID=171674 RepID=UPI003F17CBF9
MQAIKLFLTGDVMTGRGIDQVLPWPCEPGLYERHVTSARQYVALAEEANGPLPWPVDLLYPWGDALAEPAERRVDLRIINLETSVTRHSVPELKGINYRMSPENFACITAAGIDCCVLANNHVLDWGRPGLIETLDTIAASGIPAPGAGRGIAEATAPAILPLPERGRVLVYAAASADSGVPQSWLAGPDRPGVNLLTDLSADTARRIGAQLETASQAGDIMIVSIHWGGNWGYGISRSHRAFAHALIDEAGIDLVHGHSSHHPKAIEVHHGRLILYGCGDFITDYEGITGYEAFRDDLVLMYLPVLAADGALQDLTMVPFQLRQLRLNRAEPGDIGWLRGTLDRECRRFDGGVVQDDTGALHLEWV